MKHWWQCMILVLVVATRGVAQDLSVGARLRVTRANGQSITGQLAALDERNFTLEQRDGSGRATQVVVSRENAQRIQISRAPSRKGRGAGIGFLIGAAFGAAAGYAAGSDCSNREILCISRGAGAGVLGVFFGGLGAGIGAVAAHGEKWETVGPAHVSVSVIPVRRGAGIAVVARF
jgi:hypothetical protein